MNLPQILEEAEKKFDEKFYKNHSTRQWLSRGGESYDSEHPQMGRAEILRFIESQLTLAYNQGLEEGKKLKK